jgi:hypothetical protein
MRNRVIILVGCGLMLSACAGPGPGVTGNDTGGIIPYASFSRLEARQLATNHCAMYGKLAHARSVDPRYGGYYSFACVFDRRQKF